MMKRLGEIIRQPYMTEKGQILQNAENKYVFRVDRNANKLEIKRAVEQAFSVRVKKVRTLNVSGKLKKYGRFSGYRSDWKKAIVTVESGQTIGIFEGT